MFLYRGVTECWKEEQFQVHLIWSEFYSLMWINLYTEKDHLWHSLTNILFKKSTVVVKESWLLRPICPVWKPAVHISKRYASLVAQTVKRLPTVRETWVPSLGQEDPLEKGMATHSSTLAWKIPWTEERSSSYSAWGRKESVTTERLHFHFTYNTYMCSLPLLFCSRHPTS